MQTVDDSTTLLEYLTLINMLGAYAMFSLNRANLARSVACAKVRFVKHSFA